jgi:hypothetical protein
MMSEGGGNVVGSGAGVVAVDGLARLVAMLGR